MLRNDLVPNAEFRYPTIRFNWVFFEKEAHRLGLDVNSNEFAFYVLGVLAHEYGHFLEILYFNDRPSESLCSPIEGCRDGLKSWRRELWADSVAGCVLGQIAVHNTWLVRSMQGLSEVKTLTHPPAKMRARAVELGWERCTNTGVPSVVRRELLKQRSTDGTRLTGGNLQ